MSIRVMTLIWDTCLYQSGTLNVLLAMADFANDRGDDIFPGIDNLAAKCRQSIRATQDCIKRLRADGVVKLLGPNGQDLEPEEPAVGGRGRRTEFRIDLQRAQELQGLHEAENPDCIYCEARRKRAEKRVQKPAAKGAVPVAKGAVSDTKGADSRSHIENHQEPSVEPSSEPERETGAGARERATIGDLCTAFAGWPNVDPAFSRTEIGAAYTALGADAPTLDELLACALARGKWLAEQNAKRKPSAGPYLVQAPHRWISECKWAGELKRLHDGAPARAAAIDKQTAIRQRLGDETVSKLLRSFNWAEIEAWFGNCDFVPGPPPAFTFAREFERRWVSGHHDGRIRRLFGEDVVFSVKAKVAA